MTDLKTLWKSQEMEDIVTLENVHQKAAGFQRRVHRRNMIEYIAAVFVVIVFGFYVWALPGLMVKAGSALCIAGVLFVVWQLHRRGSAQSLPDEAARGLIDFHRAALVRQRDALRTVWRWYLAPVVPGMVLMLVGIYFNAPLPMRGLALHFILLWVALPGILVFLGIWLLNLRGAKYLQRRIDDLDPHS